MLIMGESRKYFGKCVFSLVFNAACLWSYTLIIILPTMKHFQFPFCETTMNGRFMNST